MPAANSRNSARPLRRASSSHGASPAVVALAHQPPEPQRQLDPARDRRAVGQQPVAEGRLVRRAPGRLGQQQPARPARRPVAHRRRLGRQGGDVDRRGVGVGAGPALLGAPARQPGADDRPPAGEAERLDLAEQPGRVAAALGPALAQVGRPGVDQAAAVRARAGHRAGVGAQVLHHRRPAHPQPAADRADRAPVAGAAPGRRRSAPGGGPAAPRPPPRAGSAGAGRAASGSAGGGAAAACSAATAVGGGAQRGVVPDEQPLQRLAGVGRRGGSGRRPGRRRARPAARRRRRPRPDRAR